MAETKEKDYSITSLIIDACEEYDDLIDADEYGENEDMIHEIADNSVPIYYWDIAQYAAHNSWLMTTKPDCCNPEANAHDQIQANIAEYVEQGLYEHKQEKEDD